jgi:hypothetical protein
MSNRVRTYPFVTKTSTECRWRSWVGGFEPPHGGIKIRCLLRPPWAENRLAFVRILIGTRNYTPGLGRQC